MPQAQKRKAYISVEPSCSLTFDSPLTQHLLWSYHSNLTDKEAGSPDNDNTSRAQVNNFQITGRLMVNLPAFVNLFRRYKDEAALQLTDQDIKLIQIAALFSRFYLSSQEKKDASVYQKCATLLYLHLTNTLKISPVKSEKLAEVIANYRIANGNNVELIRSADDSLTWQKKSRVHVRTILQKIFHDAYYLDLMRAPYIIAFNGDQLYFYKDIANSNINAFNELTKLISETRSLIELHNISRRKNDLYTKSRYNSINAIDSVQLDLAHGSYELFNSLHAQSTVLKNDDLVKSLIPSYADSEYKSVTEESLTAAMHNGHLYARGVSAPSATPRSRTKDFESGGEIEVRKHLRTVGTQTNTKKNNGLTKNGNDNRSATLLTELSNLYAGQGFLILNPSLDNIKQISQIDADTGRGKKKNIEFNPLDVDDKIKQLNLLCRSERLGGALREGVNLVMKHNEVIIRVTKVDAIFFTQDPTFYNEMTHGEREPCNEVTHYLQARHLQDIYKRVTGVELPIFEYSGIHGFIRMAPLYTDDQITEMWVSIVSKLIKEKLKSSGQISQLMTELKIEAIDGYLMSDDSGLIRKQAPLDSTYTPEYSFKLYLALHEAQKKCIEDHHAQIIQAIQAGSSALFSPGIFFTLIHSPQIIHRVRHEIILECKNYAKTDTLDLITQIKAIKSEYLSELTYYNFFNNPITQAYFFAVIYNDELENLILSVVKAVIINKLNCINHLLMEVTFKPVQLTQLLTEVIDLVIRFNFLKTHQLAIENKLIASIKIFQNRDDPQSLLKILLIICGAGLMNDKIKPYCLAVIEDCKRASGANKKMLANLDEIKAKINTTCHDSLLLFCQELKDGAIAKLKAEEVKFLEANCLSKNSNWLFNCKRAANVSVIAPRRKSARLAMKLLPNYF